MNSLPGIFRHAFLLLLLTVSTTQAAPDCVSGYIKALKYNSDDSISVYIADYAMFTRKTNLQPLLFAAFSLKADITIRSDRCFNLGEFSEVVFEFTEAESGKVVN